MFGGRALTGVVNTVTKHMFFKQMKYGICWLPLLLILFLDLNEGRKLTDKHQGTKVECKKFLQVK